MVWPSSCGSFFYLYLTKHSMCCSCIEVIWMHIKYALVNVAMSPWLHIIKYRYIVSQKKTEPIFESPISRWSWEFLEVLGQNLGISRDILEVDMEDLTSEIFEVPPTHRLGWLLGRFFQFLGYSWEEIFKDLGISLEFFLTGICDAAVVV